MSCTITHHFSTRTDSTIQRSQIFFQWKAGFLKILSKKAKEEEEILLPKAGFFEDLIYYLSIYQILNKAFTGERY